MKVQVATGDPRDVSYRNSVLIIPYLVNEDATLVVEGYPDVETTRVEIKKWWKNIKEPLPVLVTAEGKPDVVEVYISRGQNARRISYKGLRVASVKGYETALVWVRLDTSVGPQRLNTNLNRLVLGVKDYMDKVPDGSVKSILFYLVNKEEEVVEGLRKKLKKHGL